ncbi:unnamed protein product [Sphagnum balticum]
MRMQQTAEPFRKNLAHKRLMDEERLRNEINAKYMESEKEDLRLKLRKNMSFADTSTNKPMMWSRIILGEAGLYKDFQ